MDCERCKAGGMEPVKIRRFPRAWVALGYLIWIPAVLALAVGTIGSFVTIGRGPADPA